MISLDDYIPLEVKYFSRETITSRIKNATSINVQVHPSLPKHYVKTELQRWILNVTLNAMQEENFIINSIDLIYALCVLIFLSHLVILHKSLLDLSNLKVKLMKIENWLRSRSKSRCMTLTFFLKNLNLYA